MTFDEATYEPKDREQQEATAMLMGRISYEDFAPVWPSMEEFTQYNAMPKYLVSSTLQNPQWHNTSVLSSLEEVARLKETVEGTILVHGSATLAKGLAAARLVDRNHLLVFPLLLGAGRRLFDDTTDTFRTLELVEHEAYYSNGIVKTVYDVVH